MKNKSLYKVIVSLIILILGIVGIYQVYNAQCTIDLSSNIMGQEINIETPKDFNFLLCVAKSPYLTIISILSSIAVSIGGYGFFKSLINYGDKK